MSRVLYGAVGFLPFSVLTCSYSCPTIRISPCSSTTLETNFFPRRSLSILIGARFEIFSPSSGTHILIALSMRYKALRESGKTRIGTAQSRLDSVKCALDIYLAVAIVLIDTFNQMQLNLGERDPSAAHLVDPIRSSLSNVENGKTCGRVDPPPVSLN